MKPQEVFVKLISLVENVVLNSVVLFGFFSVIPAVGCPDEIQFVIAELFISTSASRLAVRHIFSRVLRGAVSWQDYFTCYALRLAFAFTSDYLFETFQIFPALITDNFHWQAAIIYR